MCVKLLISKEALNLEDWNFFLRGGTVLDRSTQPPKPKAVWITDATWDNITEVEKQLPDTFTGLSTAIAHSPKEWERWYSQTKPEETPLPAEWETKCDDVLKRMIVLRCLRPDRLIPACTGFVHDKLGKDFTDPKPSRLEDVYSESKNTDPIIFILSPGVDPSDVL